MNSAGFQRIARYMNYQRSFPTPTSARVDIPCLPYEAFTPDGTKVKPWSLIRFFESVRAVVFWPLPHAENPDRSLADLHEVIKYNQFFIVGARLDIERALHDSERRRFPLCVKVELDNVGSSSKRLAFKLYDAKCDELYATCCVDDVLVSVATRQKAPYPDWWMDKYAPLCTGQKSDILKLDTPINGKIANRDTRVVEFSDTDDYGHTNWSSYIKFVFDSIQQNVQHGKYSYLSNTHLDAGLKSMQMSYKLESNSGDKLQIQSWDTMDATAGPVLNCDVTKDGKSCFQSKSIFYA